MKLKDIISFRKDLLFQGAVQVGWFETDPKQGKKAAEHYVFHGPSYHGVAASDFVINDTHQLIDTASFTRDILKHLHDGSDDPFALAIAGYGTGKSHLGITLSNLLSDPSSKTAVKIKDNIKSADPNIGAQLDDLLEESEEPYLVVAINGMQDFDLVNEVTRQVFLNLNNKGLNTKPLEDLRPRFKTAQQFVKSFYSVIKDELVEGNGSDISEENILQELQLQNEDIFKLISEIYEQRMGDSIRAVGQEDLQRFLSVFNKSYCGADKPFKGLIIIFDEFGRYLEFAVEKPHIAGSGGLQQLFEAVQENNEKVFLLCFIQYELKAYMQRVRLELRNELERYVTRYDSVQKVKLSTNLETLIANLLEKKDLKFLNNYIDKNYESSESDYLIKNLTKWFPGAEHYNLWNDKERFEQIILKGCWPLHPLATWLLYRLSSVGKSLQQRSAFSFLSDAFANYEKKEITDEAWTISAVDLCSKDMINEFLTSENYGQQGAVANAYETALNRYEHELTSEEKAKLKAILIASKIGLHVSSQSDCIEALSLLSGIPIDVSEKALSSLLKEYGVIEWNERSNKYEIIGDAVPRRAFNSYLQSQIEQIDSEHRAKLFTSNFRQWCNLEFYETDFGLQNNIPTNEWRYEIKCSDVSELENQIKFDLLSWNESLEVDKAKGKLIYCYVGPESSIDTAKEIAELSIKEFKEELKFTEFKNIPLSIIFLNDKDGQLGEDIAEYWILNEKITGEDADRYSNFINDRKDNALEEIKGQFRQLEKEKHICIASDADLPGRRIKNTLTVLFDVTYDRRIPFPFDGFHTAKGNAAKDSNLFITELFTGNLNKGWIAARKAQQKNRATKVLHSSWEAIARDGSIRPKPGLQSVGNIIDEFDTELKSEGRLNLGQSVRKICKPPYGCNLASAGMLIGTFVASRKDSISYLQDNEIISVENWIRDAFNGNFLNVSILDNAHIQYISDKQSSEWEALLNDWDLAKTYVDQIAYMKKAYFLKENVTIPPAIYYRYELLNNKAQEALAKVNKWELKIEEQEKYIEKSMQSQNAGSLSRCGAELVDVQTKMEYDQELWASSQFDEIEPHILLAKQATVQFFPMWLERQVVIDPREVGSFEHRMLRLFGPNLRKLGLEEQLTQLEEHVEKVREDVNERLRLKYVIDESENFITSHQVNSTTKVSELKLFRNTAKELIEKLDQALQRDKIPQLPLVLEKVRKFRDGCKVQLKEHEKRAGAIWGSEINNIESVLENSREVRALISLYEGLETDLEDFNIMINILSEIDSQFQQLSLFELTNDELDKKCLSFINETNAKLSEDDEIPWDIEESYEKIFDSIREQRAKSANTWIDENINSVRNISSLEAKDAYQLQQSLQATPKYLDKVQLKQVDKALKECGNRLDDLKVDGLLVSFQGLSKEARKVFLEKAKTMA